MDTPEDLKGRPIIAGPCSPTSRLSELLENILSPLVKHLQSFIKDDWDFLRKHPREFNLQCNLYSFDIVSLYTNISHDLGIRALQYWIDRYRDLVPGRLTSSFIEEVCLFILTNNHFKFDSNFYRQLNGTAMGTKFAPPYACLAVGFLEESKLYPELPLKYTSEHCNWMKKVFLRFMDDCFTPWPKAMDIFTFKNLLNNLDENIRFTLEPAEHFNKGCEIYQKLNFLDITVILHKNGKVDTDIYIIKIQTHMIISIITVTILPI